MYKYRIDIVVPENCTVTQFLEIMKMPRVRADREAVKWIKHLYPDLISYSIVFVDEID